MTQQESTTRTLRAADYTTRALASAVHVAYSNEAAQRDTAHDRAILNLLDRALATLQRAEAAEQHDTHSARLDGWTLGTQALQSLAPLQALDAHASHFLITPRSMLGAYWAELQQLVVEYDRAMGTAWGAKLEIAHELGAMLGNVGQWQQADKPARTFEDIANDPTTVIHINTNERELYAQLRTASLTQQGAPSWPCPPKSGDDPNVWQGYTEGATVHAHSFFQSFSLWATLELVDGLTAFISEALAHAGDDHDFTHNDQYDAADELAHADHNPRLVRLGYQMFLAHIISRPDDLMTALRHAYQELAAVDQPLIFDLPE